jgi:hypothetical protein
MHDLAQTRKFLYCYLQDGPATHDAPEFYMSSSILVLY